MVYHVCSFFAGSSPAVVVTCSMCRQLERSLGTRLAYRRYIVWCNSSVHNISWHCHFYSSVFVVPVPFQSGLKEVMSEEGGLEVRVYYLECLAQATYVVSHDGKAFIIDPRRDVESFLVVRGGQREEREG